MSSLFAPGQLALGCNYWSSHAGTSMWRDWRPDVVDADLEKLAHGGLKWLRVFPLWPDFQPITLLRGAAGAPIEVRMGELPLPDGPVGQAGVSQLMLDRFSEFCRIAGRHDLRLVVGLVTGWMSGRLFVPPALEGLDPITDTHSMAWQVRFVRTFVTELRDQPAIDAWDLGNECNCMGSADSASAAYVWTATVSNAIRAADPTRPVVSGMHSLSTRSNPLANPWLIEDQGELIDVLTTHPYPYWVRHTATDAVDDFRTTLHATAECRFYADIGGKPCIAEETGTMGPMIASDRVSADFARVNMFSLWANDCRAMAWWCAHDQTDLSHAPYDWNGVELELGLLRNDGSAKPVLEEMTAFGRFVEGLPFAALSPPVADALCILTRNQDDWSVAFSAHVLATRATLSLAYRHIEQDLPAAPLYLLPSLKGANCVPRRKWLELLERVRAGATLYISLGDGIVPHFNDVVGVEIIRRARASADRQLTLTTGASMPITSGDELDLEPTTATVLGQAANGSPLFWRNSYGEGTVYVLAAPIEDQLTRTPRAFSGAGAHWQIYREIASNLVPSRRLRVDDPFVAHTEHDLGNGQRVACLINHSAERRGVSIEGADGIALACHRGTLHRGHAGTIVTIDPFDAALLCLGGAGLGD